MRDVARFVAAGAGAFGTCGMAAGFIWSWFDFPFAIGVEWAIGMAVLGWLLGGRRIALRAGIAGGILFPITFLVAVFFAIADGSPVTIGGAAAFGIGAAAAGAVVGATVRGGMGALAIALGAGIGYWIGALLGTLSGGAWVETSPGLVQSLQFALGSLIRGSVAGAVIGAAFAWLALRRPMVPSVSAE